MTATIPKKEKSWWKKRKFKVAMARTLNFSGWFIMMHFLWNDPNVYGVASAIIIVLSSEYIEVFSD